MHVGRRTSILAVAAVAVASGCSLFTSLGDFTTEATDGVDGAAVDGTTTASDGGDDSSLARDGDMSADAFSDASDARPDDGAPPVNRHPFPDFEVGGCNGWGTFRGVLSASTTAHTGNGACRVCTDGSGSEFTADDNGGIASTIGATYRAEVWVRADPQKPAPPYVGMSLRTRNDGPFLEVEKSYQGLGGPPNASWQKLTTTLTITKAAQKVNVVVGGDYATNACFLIDDVALYELD